MSQFSAQIAPRDAFLFADSEAITFILRFIPFQINKGANPQKAIQVFSQCRFSDAFPRCLSFDVFPSMPSFVFPPKLSFRFFVWNTENLCTVLFCSMYHVLKTQAILDSWKFHTWNLFISSLQLTLNHGVSRARPENNKQVSTTN